MQKFNLAQKAGIVTLWVGLLLGLTMASAAMLVWAIYTLGANRVSPPILFISISLGCGFLAWLSFTKLGARISAL